MASSLYARMNPVKRARMFTELLLQLGSVAGGHIAIVEEDGDYFQYCETCGLAMTSDASRQL